MKSKEVILNYISYRKAMGEKFRTNETYLKAFLRYIRNDIDIKCVTEKTVVSFLYGDTSVTSAWFIKYSALLGFYNYALSRNLVDFSPLPRNLPKRPPSFIPYIYTRTELRNLFKTAFTYQTNRSHVKPYMISKLLVILYATGLRLSEALSLTMIDVDLSQAIITVKQTKFYKGRLVPFGAQLMDVIRAFIGWRKKQGFPEEDDAPFFYGRDSKALNQYTVENAFLRIRERAGVQRSDGAKYQPRLHDLRHTFAVHRLTSWYQENADVQQLLPVLSTYMGHTHLAATTVYLTMTNDLLQQAGRKFEEYARGKNDGD